MELFLYWLSDYIARYFQARAAWLTVAPICVMTGQFQEWLDAEPRFGLC
jgi:hypothetical protein